MEDESLVSLAFGWEQSSSRVCKGTRGKSREAFSMDYCLVPKAAGVWRQYENAIACVFHIGGDCKKVPLEQSKDPVWQEYSQNLLTAYIPAPCFPSTMTIPCLKSCGTSAAKPFPGSLVRGNIDAINSQDFFLRWKWLTWSWGCCSLVSGICFLLLLHSSLILFPWVSGKVQPKICRKIWTPLCIEYQCRVVKWESWVPIFFLWERLEMKMTDKFYIAWMWQDVSVFRTPKVCGFQEVKELLAVTLQLVLNYLASLLMWSYLLNFEEHCGLWLI